MSYIPLRGNRHLPRQPEIGIFSNFLHLGGDLSYEITSRPSVTRERLFRNQGNIIGKICDIIEPLKLLSGGNDLFRVIVCTTA